MRCSAFFPRWHNLQTLDLEVLLIFGLIFLNLRGVKESVLFLLPIFLLFIAMHMVGITLGGVPHLGNMPTLVSNSYQETVRRCSEAWVYWRRSRSCCTPTVLAAALIPVSKPSATGCRFCANPGW